MFTYAVQRARSLLALGCLILVSALVYAPNLDDYFLGDDFDLIGSFQDKPASYFVRLLAAQESGDVWTSLGLTADQGHGYLRPLKIWTLKLDQLLWGIDPRGFHATSTALFAALAPLVFLVLRELGSSRGAAFVAAWGVALHPVFASIVPFNAAREETLAAALWLGAFLFFLRMRKGGGAAWPVLACYGLALLTKESAAPFVALPLAWDALGAPNREERRRLAPFHAALGGLVLAYLALRFATFGNFVGGDDPAPRFFSLQAFASFQRSFWGSVWAASPAVALAALAVMAFAVMKRRDDRPWLRLFLFLGPCWYLVTTVLLQGVYFDERHHALPMIGVALTLGLSLAVVLMELPEPWRRPLTGVALAALTAGFLPTTLSRAREWERASLAVERARAQIEQLTRDLPDGANVQLVNTPQLQIAPYYFGWGLQSALLRPFTPTHTAARLHVFDVRNTQLNRYPGRAPRRFRMRIQFSATRPGELERVSAGGESGEPGYGP